MIIDKELEFADAQSMATVTATTRTVSTNVIDLSAAGDAIEERYFVLRVDTSFTASGGAMNCTFSLETHTSSDFSSARTVLWQSAAIAKATLAAGYQIRFRVPRGLLRYVAVTCTPDTNTVTAGKFDAFLTPEIETNN